MFPAQLTERKLLIPDDSGLNPVNTAILIEILVTIYYTVNVKDENEEKRPRTPHFKNIPLLRISLTQKIFRFSSCAQQKIVKDVEPSPRCVALRFVALRGAVVRFTKYYQLRRRQRKESSLSSRRCCLCAAKKVGQTSIAGSPLDFCPPTPLSCPS